jgi:hypothetical protein
VCWYALANLCCVIGSEMVFYESCAGQVYYFIAANNLGVSFFGVISV